MLQKPQTHYRALLGYALVLPLAGLLAMCTQLERDQPQLESNLPATAQTQARKAVKVDGEVFTVVEQQPEFQGGMAALGSYIEKNLRYPATAQKAKAEGRVFVRFTVTKTGEITDVQLLRGIGYGADEEAVRVVQNMPRWKPGRQSGQLVNVRYNLPINFQLEDNKSTANDFWRSISKFKNYTLNGKHINMDALQYIVKNAQADSVRISFTINSKANIVAFNQVDE